MFIMFVDKQSFVCLIVFFQTLCSSHLLINNTQKSDLSSVPLESLLSISSQTTTLSSNLSPNNTLKTQSINDILSGEDIELTTYTTIENNNDSKSYIYEQNFNSNSKVEYDENTSQPESTSSANPLSSTSSSDLISSADPNLLITTIVSQINSSKIINQTFESGEKRRTNANPSVDDIISGILQLIGGNVKLSRPSLSKLQPLGPFRPDSVLSNTRINNRGPPKAPFMSPIGHPIPNIVPPNVLIGPGRPAGIALPSLPPHLARLPVPLNIVPTKPPFVIPESDVSFLLGLIKPHIKDEKELISLKNLPKLQTSLFNDKIKDKSTIDSVINSRPLFTEKILANPSKIQEFIQSNAYYSNIFSSLSSHLSEVNASKTIQLPNLLTIKSQTPLKVVTNISESIISSFVIPSQTESPVPTGPITDWVPVLAPTSVSDHESPSIPSDEPLIITMPEEPSVFEMIVKQQMGPKPTISSSLPIDPTPVMTSATNTSTVSKTDDMTTKLVERTSLFMDSMNISANPTKNESKEEAEIVYGRPPPINSDHKTIVPSFTTNIEEIITLLGSAEMSTNTQIKSTQTRNSIIPIGKPIVVPVEMDEVKPQIGNSRPNPNNRHQDKGKPSVSAVPTLQVGSGVTVNGDDSNDKKGILQPNGQSTQTKPLIVRRPPFRPRPNVPIVRIDTCIVGDDSTCEVALNEKCLTELGLSSCQCRPGFSRIQTRTPCVPIVSLALSLKVDRISDKKLLFNRNFMNAETEDYQYLEYESIQAINSIFSLSKLSRVYLGTKINRFYSMAGKMIVNASINLELNNATNNPSIRRYVQQELTRVIAVRNNNIGESQLWVDGSLNAIPRVEDMNECSNNELNDCFKNAKCINEFGSFRCECESGYEDKFANDKLKSGRICTSCTPAYCSNRGDCIVVNGQRECKCKGNFIGSKCDIDAEVLGVALGGSVAALIIIIITFLCLYMWNQRWKKEQQKMEAMSAASGHTFSYVNKQAATAYRLTIDDRMRWAQIAEAMASNPNYSSNYYVSPEQMSSSQHHLNHVYATPNRVSSSGTLLNDDLCAYESRQYSRSLRPKSRTTSGTHGYSVKNSGNESIYNETEFSTREMIYSPTHLIPAPRSQFSYS